MSLRIIYIDDEPALCQMLTDNCNSEHVRVESFTDPDVGLKAIQDNPPDLLFLDYRIGKLTGDDLAEQVDESIPKVLITGDLEVKPRQKFIKIFYKPFDFDEMDALIRDYL